MKRHDNNPAGFTLIELMVSIAIALLLILGVNQVFRIASETAGQGQALSTINRDNRAIQNTLSLDMMNVVPVASAVSPTADGPLFIIDSRTMPAFRNARDKSSAGDPADPLHEDKLFVNSNPTGHWSPALINFRNHRIDRLAFFIRGLYARQTASPNSGFVASSTASEAYVWYGHGMLPNPGNVYFGPGDRDPANTTNQVASDFFLCREAILLTPNPPDSSYLVANPFSDPAFTGIAGSLMPLGYQSPSNNNTLIQDSRYDIAAVSIQQFSAILSSYAGRFPSAWWYPLLSTDPQKIDAPPFRYQVDPFLTRPSGSTAAKVTSDAMAKASPCLVRGCSQFIVEFAGNFYTKNANGSVSDATTPDPTGQLDFVVDATTNARNIRWYGFPRDTNGDGVIDYRDVMPLQDILQGAKKAGSTTLLVDDVEPATNVSALPANPYTTTGQPNTGFNYVNSVTSASTYTAVWGPTSTLPFPKMIRITVAIDDPNGRLADEQFFEYVFEVQQ